MMEWILFVVAIIVMALFGLFCQFIAELNRSDREIDREFP
jgi:hypothetical protein